MAHDIVLLRDRRRSKNSFRPKWIFAAVRGLSSGTGTGGRPNGGAAVRASAWRSKTVADGIPSGVLVARDHQRSARLLMNHAVMSTRVHRRVVITKALPCCHSSSVVRHQQGFDIVEQYLRMQEIDTIDVADTLLVVDQKHLQEVRIGSRRGLWHVREWDDILPVPIQERLQGVARCGGESVPECRGFPGTCGTSIALHPRRGVVLRIETERE